MTDREKKNFHIIFAILGVMLISTFEASLWHDLLSPIPNPQIWLSISVYVFLYRSRLESLLIIYIPSLLLFILTMQPLGFLLLAQTLVLLLVLFIKNRIFIPGSLYYGALNSLSVFTLQFFIFLFSWIFEIKMTSYPQVWKWFVQAFLAFIVSQFLFRIYEKLFPAIETSTDGALS